MSIEDSIFQRHRPELNLLKKYGFTKQNDRYVFTKQFLDGQFEAKLTVSLDGTVQGQVVDSATGMAYLPLRAAHRGAFAATVYQHYVSLLKEIAAQCFISELFTTDQANWLVHHIKQDYGDDPAFPFARSPHTAVFREPQFQKEYAVIADLKRDQLVGKDSDGADDLVSTLTFRITETQRQALLKRPGFYPAVGTTKKNWLTVVLDGSQSDQTILQCLQGSHELLTKPKFWIVPANPKYYDIVHTFDQTEVIEWKQAANIRVGDRVFMYVTAPVKAVLFECRVLANNIPYHYQSQKLRVQKVMKIKIIKRFDPHHFDLNFLRQHGISYIRGPRHLTETALKAMTAAKANHH